VFSVDSCICDCFWLTASAHHGWAEGRSKILRYVARCPTHICPS
jgi:hypothetical protein